MTGQGRYSDSSRFVEVAVLQQLDSSWIGEYFVWTGEYSEWTGEDSESIAEQFLQVLACFLLHCCS